MTAESKTYRREWERTRKEAGLCLHCGGPHTEGRICAACRVKARERARKYNHALTKAGICTRCGKPHDRGTQRCAACTRACGEYQRDYQRARKEAGLCSLCGESNDTTTSLCSACKGKARAYRLEWERVRKGKPARVLRLDVAPIPVPAGVLDETGHKYGRLRVLRYVGTLAGGKAGWLCLCDPALGGCGAQAISRGDRLRRGRTVSCGCWRANHDVRQAARLKVPTERRRAIAQSGGIARHKLSEIAPSAVNVNSSRSNQRFSV